MTPPVRGHAGHLKISTLTAFTACDVDVNGATRDRVVHRRHDNKTVNCSWPDCSSSTHLILASLCRLSRGDRGLRCKAQSHSDPATFVLKEGLGNDSRVVLEDPW